MFTDLSRQSKGGTAYVMKPHTGRRHTALLIPNIGTRWRRVVAVVVAFLTPRKKQYPLGGPQSWSGHSEEGKYLFRCQD
jgi:hypothetical protein